MADSQSSDYNNVHQRLANRLGRSEGELTSDAKFGDTELFDSMQLVELLIVMEELSDHTIGDSLFESLDTVGDAVGWIVALRDGPQASD